MSVKENFITKLRKARTRHLKWVNQIKLMVSGIKVDKSRVTIDQSESEFGLWFYDQAMVFSTHNSKIVLDEIDTHFTQCFEYYIRIYHIMDKSNGKGIFGIFGNERPSTSDLIVAQNYYEELVKCSDKMLNALRLFESQMLATTDTRFDEMLLGESSKAGDDPADSELGREPSRKMFRYRGQVVYEE